MPPTPNDPVLKAKSYLECLEVDVDGGEFHTIPPTPKDPVSMATPYLECSKADVDVDVKDEEEEEDTYEKLWSKEIQERFENWFREYPSRPKGIDTYRFGEDIVEGTALMEIVDVRVICHTKSKRKLNLNGTITVRGSYGESEIFARTRERPEKLYPQETLALTGPNIGTLGRGRVQFSLDLKDGNRQVCKREGTWSSMSYGLEFKFGHPMTHKFKGKKGFDFQVQYAVFQNANLVTVDIELPKIINGQSVPVETVEAYIETAECRFPKTTLFNWKRNNVEVNSEGGELPLSKSLIVCPVGGAILLDLFFRNDSNSSVTTKRVNSNSSVTRERVKFAPRCFGGEKMVVPSEYGSVVVNFKAYPVDVHPPTLAAAKFHYWRLSWPEPFEKYLKKACP